MPAQKGKARREGQLVSGRHGLPREVVEGSQRKRMLAGVLQAISERGYSETRVVDIIARAGVSRRTFYEHFPEKEECFFAAYDQAVARATERAASAFEAGGGRSWPERVRHGVRAFVEDLAARPDAARVCMVDVMAAGPRGVARRDAALRGLTYLVDAGRSEARWEVPGRTAVAVLGGADELLAGELLHGTPDSLLAVIPDIVYLITCPFVGPEAALHERALARSDA